MIIKNKENGDMKVKNIGKSILTLVVIITIISISGCQSAPQKIFDTEVYHGTDGLLLDFAKNMPPEDITDKVTFQIGVELRNKGTTNIEGGYLSLINFYPDQMVLLDESKVKSINLDGKSIYNSEGGYDLKTFTIENKGLPVNQRSEANFLFKTIACYKYKTTASVNVCIKPVNFGVSTGTINCEVKNEDISGGQGAPVAITRVEESLLPSTDDKTGKTTYTGIYKILIENVGKGHIVNPYYYGNECTQESYPKMGNYDVIKNENLQVSLSNNLLTCSPISSIKTSGGLSGLLSGNTGFFTVCNANLGELNDAYTTPMTISLEYGYVSEETQKTVFVKKISQNSICPADKCIRSQQGVCDQYGGENTEATPNCQFDEKCCYESLDRCVRNFGSDDYSCKQRDLCSDPDNTIEGFCPGGDDIACCK